MEKTYYFPDAEHIDRVFGSEYPVCIDFAELDRLSREWEDPYSGVSRQDIPEEFHVATADEIERYGVYDS